MTTPMEQSPGLTTDPHDVLVEAVMECVQRYGSTKQAFGQAFEGDRTEAKERHGARLQPAWDATRQAIKDALATARCAALDDANRVVDKRGLKAGGGHEGIERLRAEAEEGSPR